MSAGVALPRDADRRSAFQAVSALFRARHCAFSASCAPSDLISRTARAKDNGSELVRCQRDRGESVKGGATAPLSQKDSSNRESRRDLRFPARSAGRFADGALDYIEPRRRNALPNKRPRQRTARPSGGGESRTLPHVYPHAILGWWIVSPRFNQHAAPSDEPPPAHCRKPELHSAP